MHKADSPSQIKELELLTVDFTFVRMATKSTFMTGVIYSL